MKKLRLRYSYWFKGWLCFSNDGTRYANPKRFSYSYLKKYQGVHEEMKVIE